MACSAIAWSFVETIGDLEVSLIFPSSRTLYPTSPSLRWVAWASLPHLHRYYARLRLPFAPLDALCFHSVTDTWFTTSRCLCPLLKRALARSSPQSARAVWSTGSPLSSGFAHQETNGPPKFPDYPFEGMPCSQTPVETCSLALSCPGLLPSAPMTASAFGGVLVRTLSVAKHYFTSPQLYKFRGSITRPAPSLALASDFRYRTDPQGSLLACWLNFSQVGLSPTG